MAHKGKRMARPSRVLARLVDHRKHLDYLWLALFAALPILLAWWIGALRTFDGFAGYWDRYNWRLLVIVLPTAAFSLRWVVKHIGPVSSPHLPPLLPPVVGLIKTDRGKEMAYAALRAALLSPKNLFSALLITLLIHVADTAQLVGVYLSGISQVCDAQISENCAIQIPGSLPRLRVKPLPIFSGVCCEVEKDWSVAFLSSEKIGKWPNLGLNVSAYSVQFALVFMGVLLMILMLRHNLFFLARVYQRRRVIPGEESFYVHIDLDDTEKCFGFRPANDAFNVQVLGLAIAGVLILITRFANVSADSGLFPDAGQWLAILVWLAALAIISLPILVKLLPRLPSQGAAEAAASLVGYLREFLSDEAWVVGNETPPEEIDAVAAQFAENAFWPTGNNRAWQLFFLSFWVLFIALVPDPRAITRDLPPWSMIAGWGIAGVLAWGTTSAFFRFLRAMLAYVDERLVEQPVQVIAGGMRRRRKLPISVFISYRRADTAAYTGRLFDSLSDRIDKDRVFIDIDKLAGGVNFVEELKKAIDSAHAMIVVIGPKWLTISDDDGNPRIRDPADFVHQEVAQGLKRGIRVFPVLVGGAPMPTAADLPVGLKKLAAHNAREITDSHWSQDVDRLIDDLETVTPAKTNP